MGPDATGWTARSIDRLRRGISEPSLLLWEAHERWRQVHQVYWSRREHAGFDVSSQEWDTLIVLDACRYDAFEAANVLPGTLSPIRSEGSQTAEWLDASFGGVFADTVYVSGNPNVAHLDAEFADVVRLWIDDWDEQLSTARPETVAERALDAHHTYPEKRLIVHFVQSHEPYIGETDARFEQFGFTGAGVVADERPHESLFTSLKRRRVSQAAVRRAYRENLDLVLAAVGRLVDSVDGRTVITADHGEAFGEWGIYGHPSGVYIDSLVTVPWFVVEGDRNGNGKEDGRRSITGSETTVPTRTEDDTSVEDRLADLGYR